MYRDEGDALFDHIITGDKMWVHYWTPKSKAATMQWKHKGVRMLEKFKKTTSTGKVMTMVFWDRWGVLLIEYLPKRHISIRSYTWETQLSENARGSWVKAFFYCKMLVPCGSSHSGITCQFGLVRVSSSRIFTERSAFWLLPVPGLKKVLGRRHFQTTTELNEVIDDFFHKWDPTWFAAGIEKLLYCYNNCLDVMGNFVEK